ncbi:MAG: 16S rRNA (guanine(527)-N(7))-methyltransferase RsmG [Corallococcus sp.]|nr:16S rRNA (guanine(527)-N(7))-methyltransferase RsmG [Corallococcus sp.]MCM1359964.1 16S rRNA (guanine(527)-N(7))-methyltransferase RsmG [Corallococcus sp.]MCM1395520.1 16S rRNA (guanine(527)-N(7))-methyltransferase RsmG [Corallococcus sp.]
MKNYIYEQTGILLSEKQIGQLETYCDFLLEENEKFNLTAITERAAVWEKHFADSILGAVAIPQNCTVCDVGSGAGFPSLPIKIARNDVSVTLVDSLEKRIDFTRRLCKKIGIDASFFHERAEDFAKKHAERFDVATARAVAPLNVLLEYVAQTVKIGGHIIAYKTDAAELQIAENACKILGLQYVTSHAFVLPEGGKRCIMVFEKVRRTPSKYPRSQNKPRKQPLGA